MADTEIPNIDFDTETTLTTGPGLDILTGTNGSDLYFANANASSTLSPGDNVNGLAGIDMLDLVITGDNPVLDIRNDPQSLVIPLDPRHALFVHVGGSGVNPQPLTDKRVSLLNAIRRMDAERWLVSRTDKPSIAPEEEVQP